MRIGSYSVDMSSKTTYLEEHTKEEALKIWTGDVRPDFEGQSQSMKEMQNYKSDIVEISLEGRNQFTKSKNCDESDSVEYEVSENDKLKINLIEKFIKSITGKGVKLHVADKIKLKGNNVKLNMKVEFQNLQNDRYGWGLEYDYHQKHYEKETMNFNSNGTIKTSDGRELSFSIDLSMKREFMSQEDISIRAGDAAIDPLVINFDNNAVGLTDDKINFDLNFDGKKEEISFVSHGSGFLALDLNGDGIINDGKELFGPKSGDGFSELAKYDSDGNNWIDESDPVFDRLKIWVKDEEGNDALFTLKQKGIGALYINNVDTSFNIKDDENNSKGKIQKTGIFLKENGTAGTLQHIDISI